MKRILLTLLVGAALTCPALAQDNTDSTTPPPPHHGPGGPGGPRGFGNLTPDERKQLFTDHEAALKANPDLAAQEKDLHEKQRALEKAIDAAMVKADPSVAPILAKLHDEGHGRKHKDGDAAPADNSGGTSDN